MCTVLPYQKVCKQVSGLNREHLSSVCRPSAVNRHSNTILLVGIFRAAACEWKDRSIPINAQAYKSAAMVSY